MTKITCSRAMNLKICILLLISIYSAQVSGRGSDTPVVWRQEGLKAHNDHRKAHGSADLSQSEELCKLSDDWADKLADRMVSGYSVNEDIGENIWTANTNDIPVSKTVVDFWYSANSGYNFNTPDSNDCMKTGNFTQIVWKATTQVCVSYSIVEAPPTVVVVAVYKPPGNIEGPGEYARNVGVGPGGVNNSHGLRITFKNVLHVLLCFHGLAALLFPTSTLQKIQ